MSKIKTPSGNKIYELFDKFIESFIISKQFCVFNNGQSEKFKFDEAFSKMKECFINNPIEGNKTIEDDFSNKLELQFIGKDAAKLCFAHINWLWAFAASDMKDITKNTFPFENPQNIEINKDFKISGFVGMGSAKPRQQKYREVKFLIYAIEDVWEHKSKDVETAKVQLLSYINTTHKDKDLDENLPIKNALRHLCSPDNYEPIFSNGQKEGIVKAFECIINNNDNYDDLSLNEIDRKLLQIRKTLVSDSKLNDDFSFYDSILRVLWQSNDNNVDSLSRVQLLEYKKAMVLYGPPGTGKTYTAMELAKQVVLRSVMKAAKDATDTAKRKKQLEIVNTLLSPSASYDDYIFYLQFHVNYTYEDFIAGHTIEDNNVKTKKGFIFDIIDKANKGSDMSYVVILDEINRVDVSRVFGELFTAIEKRDENVYLTLPETNDPSKRLSLNIPKNIYFIGTMNQIDFSLEQIDFAFRRRFIWELHDYNEDALDSIITTRLGNQCCDGLDDYLKCCTNLNNKIKEVLGAEYHIGHAFFAEVANIYTNLKENNISRETWNKAIKVLWQISIRPTLEAYCGSMDKDEKKKFIDACEKIFLKGMKEDETSETQSDGSSSKG